MVLASVVVVNVRCRYFDRFMLVDFTAVTMGFVSPCGAMDDLGSGSVRDGSDIAGALLEVCDKHDGTGDADRATYGSCVCSTGRASYHFVNAFYSSIGVECDDGGGLPDVA